MTSSEELRQLFLQHQENALNGAQVTWEQVQPLLDNIKEYSECTVDLLGYSAEGRSIQMVRWGHGPKRVLMWSQMHGDEPTATRAIFDLLNFLLNNWQHDLPYQLQQQVTIYFIPLLNPDGAERNWRYNAWGIDLNRDAQALQTPEARILKHIAEVIAPHYAFNLHDQYSYYSAGMHHLPAAISFLANPTDRENSLPPQRRESMQLIAHINQGLQAIAPQQVGRYVSDFDPTSFGDTFQKMGMCTMLVEAGGGWEENRQLARCLNFVALALALEAIGTGAHLKENEALYAHIPENKLRLYDFLLRNVSIPIGNAFIKGDVAVNIQRKWNGAEWDKQPFIANFGDLSAYNGLQEYDGEGARLAATVVRDAVANLKLLDYEGNERDLSASFFC